MRGALAFLLALLLAGCGQRDTGAQGPSPVDPWEAARFATQLSARSVTRSGLAAIPTEDEINNCMVEVL